jgi:hypothetical protein
MRSRIMGLSLLALVIGFAHPARAGTLNDLFTFSHITYARFPLGVISGSGSGGQYLGMGDLTFQFRYMPDPEGGHPISRKLHIFGAIPELGIEEDCGPPDCALVGLIYGGVILEDPAEFPGFLRFPVGGDAVHPALAFLEGVETWDIALPIPVPTPPAGLLLGAALLLTARRWLRRL